MAFTVKLGNRLSSIELLVANNKYQHVWDCCCDHGLLGMSLLARNVAPHIHFVDIVPELVNNVTDKLQRFFNEQSQQWQTHCLNVQHLPLAQYPGKHLVIIAGVGGDLMTTFVDEIAKQHANLSIDFLLCPVHHQYTLREKLINLQFSLIKEVLLEENNRFYEVLYVSSAANSHKKINAVGETLWQAKTEDQKRILNQYHLKTLSHYQRILQGVNSTKNQSNNLNKERLEHIISSYQAVKLTEL